VRRKAGQPCVVICGPREPCAWRARARGHAVRGARGEAALFYRRRCAVALRSMPLPGKGRKCLPRICADRADERGYGIGQRQNKKHPNQLSSRLAHAATGPRFSARFRLIRVMPLDGCPISGSRRAGVKLGSAWQAKGNSLPRKQRITRERADTAHVRLSDSLSACADPDPEPTHPQALRESLDSL